MANMIEIDGVERTARTVTIEMRQEKLVDAVLNIFYSRNKKFYGNYVDDNGYWQMFSYTNPHTDEDIYKIGHKATEEELKLASHLSFIQSLRF